MSVEIPEIPDWANWTAIDKDGEFWAFEDKPVKMETYWNGEGRSQRILGNREEWESTLVELTK